MQFTIKQVASLVRSITGDKFVGKQNALDCWIRRLIREKRVYTSSCSRKEDIISVLGYRSGKLRAESTLPHLNIRRCPSLEC